MNFENEEIIIQVSKNADYRQGEKKNQTDLRLLHSNTPCSITNENCLQNAVQYDTTNYTWPLST